MKKIVIVGPNLGFGGVERASTNIAKAFLNLGADVLYLALIPKKKLIALDEKIKYLEPMNFNKKSISFFRTLIFLRKNIIKFKPDTVLVFTKLFSALTNLALFGTKTQLYISERSSPFYRWSNKINLIYNISFFLRKPCGVIAQTKVAQDYHIKKYPNIPVVVIPNPVKKVDLYPDIRREKIILAVGRIGDSCKGFDRLVLAFNKCQLFDWILCFAGGDEKEAKFLSNIEVEEMTINRIKFLGRIENIDLVYAKAGIFVITSRSEGFPNVLIEAMAAGLACISFDFVAGPREIITHGHNGIIVEDGNIDALAESIIFLANNPEERERLGLNALQIREKLDLDIIGKKYFDFISQK